MDAKARGILAMAVLCLGVGVLRAELLVHYSFEGEVNTAAAQVRIAPSIFASVVGSISYPAGADGSVDSYSSTQWSDTGNYFLFNVVLDHGFIMTVTNLTFYGSRSSTGPTNWTARFSRDDADYRDLGSGTTGDESFGLKTGKDLQPVDLQGTNYIRIYGTNASSNSGTWRLDEVKLWGTVNVDNGTRYIRCQGYDGAHHDNWNATTNVNGGTISNSQVAANEPSGIWALELQGSGSKLNPNVVFENVSLAGVSNAVVSMAFAAKDVDGNSDLYIDASYDNGSTWSSNQLVDGSASFDLNFGAIGTIDRVPLGLNPFTFSIPGSEEQVKVRALFLDQATDPSNDYYYIDSVSLRGIPTPANAAPTISMYGGNSGATTNSVSLTGHVTGGYPYPTVTVYYGPSDGLDADGGWAFSSNLGVHAWGLFTNTLGNLSAGQKHYYRFHASNSEGGSWASSSSNFTTTAGTVSAVGGLYLDSIGIASVMPMSIDNDGDGMPDRWEEVAFGGTSSNANADSDEDQIDALYEFYAGTDPNDSNSYMRILDVDLATEAGNNVAIQWSGGAYVGGTQFLAVGDAQVARTFKIRGADSVDGAKSDMGSVSGFLQTTNWWIDTNAVVATSQRFYEIEVQYAGQGYTNTQEWAMHVQPRVAGKRYLASVPVSYGTNNTLDSTLGRQLARGLAAGSQHNEAGADQIHFVNGLSFETYTLVTNAQGDAEWWNGAGKSSRIVTPGEGFWVYRTNSVAARTNMVFVGLTRTSNVPAITISTDAASQGWDAQIVGWPYSKARATAGPTFDPFGFVTGGAYGGTKASTANNHSEMGDQIWYWKEEIQQWRYAWLVDTDGAHANLDGTWWDSLTRTNAVFSLEPGKAYYYRHHVATNGTPTGTNFTWQPVLP